jgi:hypothetical protein
MPRVAVVAVLSALLLAAAPAFAQAPAKPPDAAKVRAAAEQFDAGLTALKGKDYETAASHFEAADAAVPGAKALRQAIRARAEAGQGARAATLAAAALLRYGSDEATAKLARETIEKYEPLLHKVSVSCASPCVLAVGTRSVPGEASTRWVVYLDPGKEALSASFFGGVASAPRAVVARAGGAEDVRFEPEEKKAAVVAPPPVPAKNEVPPEEPKKDEPPPEKPKGISPAFFGVTLAATAGLGATTIWSGIDTQTNPGPDAVRTMCQGQGTSCALYQEGLAKQRRTNILIGATAGTAALTVVFAIFTRWKSAPKDPAPTPTALFFDRGAGVGAVGVF